MVKLTRNPASSGQTFGVFLVLAAFDILLSHRLALSITDSLHNSFSIKSRRSIQTNDRLESHPIQTESSRLAIECALDSHDLSRELESSFTS